MKETETPIWASSPASGGAPALQLPFAVHELRLPPVAVPFQLFIRGLTVIVKSNEPPPVPVAVIVYTAVAAAAVGVPEIFPLLLARAKPAGSAGLTVKFVAVPPVIVGLSWVIIV